MIIWSPIISIENLKFYIVSLFQCQKCFVHWLQTLFSAQYLSQSSRLTLKYAICSFNRINFFFLFGIFNLHIHLESIMRFLVLLEHTPNNGLTPTSGSQSLLPFSHFFLDYLLFMLAAQFIYSILFTQFIYSTFHPNYLPFILF